MDIIVQKAAQHDVAGITALSLELGYNVTSEQTAQLLSAIQEDDNNIVWVAISNVSVVGWMQVCYNIRLESGSFCEIVGLVISKESRGKGIGSQLLSKAINWTQDKGCKKLRVRSNIIRDDAKAFYLKSGFTITKQQNIFDREV